MLTSNEAAPCRFPTALTLHRKINCLHAVCGSAGFGGCEPLRRPSAEGFRLGEVGGVGSSGGDGEAVRRVGVFAYERCGRHGDESLCRGDFGQLRESAFEGAVSVEDRQYGGVEQPRTVSSRRRAVGATRPP